MTPTHQPLWAQTLGTGPSTPTAPGTLHGTPPRRGESLGPPQLLLALRPVSSCSQHQSLHPFA